MQKFKIPSVPPTTNKCIRFPNDIIEKVEKSDKGQTVYFYSLCCGSCAGALDNLKEENSENTSG